MVKQRGLRRFKNYSRQFLSIGGQSGRQGPVQERKQSWVAPVFLRWSALRSCCRCRRRVGGRSSRDPAALSAAGGGRSELVSARRHRHDQPVRRQPVQRPLRQQRHAVNNVSKNFESSPLFSLGIGYRHNDHLRFDLTGEYRGNATFHGLDVYDYNGSRHGHRRIHRHQVRAGRSWPTPTGTSARGTA